MYLSSKKHILSTAIMCVAAINVVAELCNVVSRKIAVRLDPTRPDMMDANIWKMQLVIAVIQLLANMLVFYLAYRKTKHYLHLIPEEDADEMAMLQKEINPTGISQLNIKDTYNLLMVWAVILLGVQFVYELTSVAYKNFITQLMGTVPTDNAEAYGAFVSMYNSSHGFKYVGMLIAITIGIVTTGIFLKDKFLIFTGGMLMVVFLIAFLWVEQTTLTISSRTISVVWTSVIFHCIQTGGLLVMAVYLRYRFKGM